VPSAPTPGRIETGTWSDPELRDARFEARNKLKQIGLAFHGFHDAYQHMPVGVYDTSGKKPGLSWRVLILPYIEEPTLYQEFKMDEPWDSDHNKKLISRMPKMYTLSGLSASNGYTHLRGFSGEGALGLQSNIGGQPGFPLRGVRITDFTDGTSNTFLVCEVAEPIIWTKPDDLNYESKKPVPKFGGVFEEGFHVVMGDGSTRFVKHSVPEEVLRALITRAGGEVVPYP
jgi:hypothetical protein